MGAMVLEQGAIVQQGAISEIAEKPWMGSSLVFAFALVMGWMGCWVEWGFR
jgi:hypothetical protein